MIDEMHIPQAEKLEQTVLGALLMEPGYLPEVVTELTPDSFYDPFNAKVYGVIRTMYDSGEQIDLFTVSQRCKRDKELAGENVVAKLSRVYDAGRLGCRSGRPCEDCAGKNTSPAR